MLGILTLTIIFRNARIWEKTENIEVKALLVILLFYNPNQIIFHNR